MNNLVGMQTVQVVLQQIEWHGTNLLYINQPKQSTVFDTETSFAFPATYI